MGDVGLLVADSEKTRLPESKQVCSSIKSLKTRSRARLVAESKMAEEGMEMPRDLAM